MQTPPHHPTSPQHYPLSPLFKHPRLPQSTTTVLHSIQTLSLWLQILNTPAHTHHLPSLFSLLCHPSITTSLVSTDTDIKTTEHTTPATLLALHLPTPTGTPLLFSTPNSPCKLPDPPILQYPHYALAFNTPTGPLWICIQTNERHPTITAPAPIFLPNYSVAPPRVSLPPPLLFPTPTAPHPVYPTSSSNRSDTTSAIPINPPPLPLSLKSHPCIQYYQLDYQTYLSHYHTTSHPLPPEAFPLSYWIGYSSSLAVSSTPYFYVGIHLYNIPLPPLQDTSLNPPYAHPFKQSLTSNLSPTTTYTTHAELLTILLQSASLYYHLCQFTSQTYLHLNPLSKGSLAPSRAWVLLYRDLPTPLLTLELPLQHHPTIQYTIPNTTQTHPLNSTSTTATLHHLQQILILRLTELLSHLTTC